MAEKSTQGSQSPASSQTAATQGTAGTQSERGERGQATRQEQGTRPGTGLAQRSPGGRSGSSLGLSPFSLMRRMMEDMDRMFEDFGGGRGAQPREGVFQRGGFPAVWAPAVDVVERDGQLVVRADLPGLKPDDVRIEVADGALTIEGERRSEMEAEEEGGVYRSERVYGRFSRTIPLPDGADIEHAQARFDEGVLEITVPLPQNGRRRIEIEGRTEGKRDSSKPSVRH
jgi:HSP20 family protein